MHGYVNCRVVNRCSSKPVLLVKAMLLLVPVKIIFTSKEIFGKSALFSLLFRLELPEQFIFLQRKGVVLCFTSH